MGLYSIMINFLKKALKPLARLCLRRGIRVQEFFEAAKLAFVDVSRDELSRLGSRGTTSRIAAMTGIQRKEVKRLENRKDEHASQVFFLAKVLGAWESNRKFTDKRGRPRELSLESKRNEFAELVLSVSSDLNPYTALFELERNGAVERDGNLVRLLHSSIELSKDQDNSLTLLAEDMDRLISSVSTNIFDSPAVPNLHARTEFDNIAPSALPKIRRWVLEQGVKFHTELRSFLSGYDRDLNPELDRKSQGVTISVGTFSDIKTGHGSKDQESK